MVCNRKRHNAIYQALRRRNAKATYFCLSDITGYSLLTVYRSCGISIESLYVVYVTTTCQLTSADVGSADPQSARFRTTAWAGDFKAHRADHQRHVSGKTRVTVPCPAPDGGGRMACVFLGRIGK